MIVWCALFFGTLVLPRIHALLELSKEAVLEVGGLQEYRATLIDAAVMGKVGVG